MLAIDLGIFNKKAHSIKNKEALMWSGIWISLALIFNAGVFYFLGNQKGLEFLTGYVLEYSLSVDNIFVFVLLLTYFKVPTRYQHKVLFWGIIGAFIMRGILIAIGASLIIHFHFVILIFGVFLVVTGVRMAFQKSDKIQPNKNPIVKFIRKVFPISDEYVKGKFFVRMKSGLMATPLLIVLVIVETTDLVFALDSIPAILAITHDTFIVFTSNAFAILGLRSLYFALAGLIDKFRYLKFGLSVVLTFIGIKMLLTDFVHISTISSLMIITIVLGLSILISFVRNK
jgi:tellurite resistance protein TerC